MNFVSLVFVTALLHFYIGARVVPDLHVSAWLHMGFIGMLMVSALTMPLGLMAKRIAKPPVADTLTWIGLLFMGLFSSVFVLTVLRDASLLVSGLASWLLPGAQLLEQWRNVSAEAVPVLGLLATLLGFLNARRTAAVVHVDVPIKGLPGALQGFTVAQISDVHVGPTIKAEYLRRIVARVNALGADMVAITGDLVDGRVDELAAQVEPLSDLRSRHGTYFVTGNHEYYSGAHAWIDELRRMGICVLMNEHVVLYHGKYEGAEDAQEDAQTMAPLVLAGVTDFSAHHFDPAHRSDPQAALEGSPLAAPMRLLLAHQPRSSAAAAKAGFDLQLSGHTHGGQFYPWNLFVQFQQPFTAGLHKLQNLWVYTSRGTGYWGPPKRFGAPSEITFLRLVAG